MIQPHGGQLVNQVLSTEQTEEFLVDKDNRLTLVVSDDHSQDIVNLATGVYSPLTGFMYKKDLQSVLKEMRLADGTVFPIPVVLDVNKSDFERLKEQNEILLTDSNEDVVALLEEIEIYQYNKDYFAKKVFGTLDKKHPGVADVQKMGDYLIGGRVKLIKNQNQPFSEYNYTPAQTRQIFIGRGWNKIVAFQTRNVPHCGHEFLQLQALAKVDGLFIQPVIGQKKLADFKDEYIISSYEFLINERYPKNKSVLGVLPLKMRYAGPKEALFHAIIRKNYGCSHFIVGRDHAGVGNYYQPQAAQEIFNQFAPDEVGVEILKFSEVVYDPQKKCHCFADQCDLNKAVRFSGTKLRQYIKNNQEPPDYLIRPEVYNILLNSKNSLVDDVYKNNHNDQKGFVLWFTGLSQSGKSTIADKVYELLIEQGIKMERLDGDVVRESLTKDLGFSKEDRDENIRRVGFVASMLSRNGVGVTASFISPYKQQRDELRMKIPNFIEIFVNTPLEICEKRDKKGLYAKARKGEIANFTGISDPYEEPNNPELELRPAEQDLARCVEEVIMYLKKRFVK